MPQEKITTMPEKEMGAKIQNAVHSIGAVPRFGFHAPVEWQTVVFKFEDLGFDSKCNIESRITAALNEGWYFSKEIICRPYVTVIFWRQKETSND